MNPADVVQAAPPIDMSFWTLFWQAHFVVKLVMMGLLGASIWCWSIIVDKTLLFRRTEAEMDAFEEVFWSGRSLEELYRDPRRAPVTGLAAVFVAAMREWKRSFEVRGPLRSPACRSASTRCSTSPSSARSSGSNRSCSCSRTRSARPGPIIGLFGTVWGIMTAFTVDRGLQEHLARGRRARHRRGAVRHRDRPVRRDSRRVLAYNKLQAEVAKAQSRLEGFADEFSAILSRQIDERLRSPPDATEETERMGMAAGAGARAAGRRRRRGRRAGAINEINMTPFIDVMLVLLIIFMVAAPMMTIGVPLDLPQTERQPLNVDQKPVTLSIDSKGQIFLARTS